MAWEWVAPTSTAALGLAGIAATYWSGRGQTETARAVAERQAQATLHLQREERQQRRIEAAYPVLLDAVAEASVWIWRVDRFVLGEFDHGRPPQMPPAAERLEMQGSLSAVWSPRVAAMVREWTMAAGSAHSCARRLGFSRDDTLVQVINDSVSGEPLDEAGQVARLADFKEQLEERFAVHRDRMLAVEVRLRDQVWRELRGEDEPTS